MPLVGDDHPEGPDPIRDLVWGTALWNMGLVDEVPEHMLFERPGQIPLATGLDQKLDAVLRREDTANDCE